MKPFLNYKSVTIPANGSQTINLTGSVFSCKGCSVPAPGVLVAFDDGDQNPCAAGWTFNMATVAAAIGAGQSQFTKVTLTNTTAVPAIVSFFVGNYAVSYNAPDNRVASTSAKGNLGLSVSGGNGSANYTVNGVTQSITFSGGGIVVPSSGYLTVYGTDNGRQRKLICFTVWNGGTVNVNDANGNMIFYQLSAAMPIAIETDATLKLSLGSGSPLLAIGEFYFSQP
jgi:hypothetical protein